MIGKTRTGAPQPGCGSRLAARENGATRRVLAGLLIAGSWMLATPARAGTIAPLPPPFDRLYPPTSTINVRVAYNNFYETSQTAPLQFTQGDPGASLSVATNGGFTSSLGISASGSASVDESGHGLTQGIASGYSVYAYYFRVYDPSPGLLVPFAVDFDLSAGGGGGGSSELAWGSWEAVAEVSIGSINGQTPLYLELGDSEFYGDSGNPFDLSNITGGPHTFNGSVYSDSMYYMYLYVLAHAACNASNDGFDGSSCSAAANASVDPSIRIDSGWLSLHPDSQLQIGTFAGAVPEPGTLALTLAAVGLIGFGRFKSRNRSGASWR